MAEQPTSYDLQQDEQIARNTQMIKPSHVPFDGPEYSFPVVGQGINSEQFQLISRAAGTGVYVQHDPGSAQSAYLLVNMPGGESETNAKNQMMLKVATPTGRNEAVIDGFFHVQQEDKIIDFPAVSTPTTYYLCLTLDPEKETDPTGPIKIVRHDGLLPTSRRRKHLVLWTVHREPNQLLTEATIQHSLSWVSPPISAFSLNQLPDPETLVYGTIGVAIHGAGYNTPTMYTSRGHHGWIPIIGAEWETITDLGNGVTHASESPVKTVKTATGIEMQGKVRINNSSGRILRLPAELRVWKQSRPQVLIKTSIQPFFELVDVESDGNLYFRSPQQSSYAWASFDGVKIPF